MTKAEIINAAFKVWGQNFYQKPSLSQLAKELKVSKPALYRHFISKKALTNAMTERFFDDFANTMQKDFENALKQDVDEGLFTIIHSITGFFARNVYVLLFSLMNIYDQNLDGKTISDNIRSRGADLNTINLIAEKKYEVSPALLKLIFATLTFFMANFHYKNDSFKNTPSDSQINDIISTIYSVINSGLKFSAQDAGSIDFDKLEKKLEGTMQKAEVEPLFKAVAEAVAEAGPWDASMEMVAKRMGLSKSSLYGHFQNKKDMLHRLFMSEFERILEYAREGIKLSGNTAEQLYLGIYSINVYLRSRPEILIAVDWIRTRKLDLGKPEKNNDIFRLFEDLEIKSLSDTSEEEKNLVTHWIFFLLINILTQPRVSNNGKHSGFSMDKVPNNDIRILYKFITMGLGGFIR